MFDRIISVVAVAQAVYVTFQAGLKLIEPHIVAWSLLLSDNNNSNTTNAPSFDDSYEMIGPRIVPETNPELFRLTEAFRCAVRLGRRRSSLSLGEYYDDDDDAMPHDDDNNNNNNDDDDSFELHFLHEEDRYKSRKPPPLPPAPYRLSLTSCYNDDDSTSISTRNTPLASSSISSSSSSLIMKQQPTAYTTLQNGDIVHKSSLDAMDLTSWQDGNNPSSSSAAASSSILLGLPLSPHVLTSSSSSSAMIIHDNPHKHHYHDDLDVVWTARVLPTTTAAAAAMAGTSSSTAADTTTTTATTTTLTAGGTTASRTTTKISAYAPATFAALRQSYGVNESEFYHVLLRSGPYVSYQANSKGSARSGGVFFFTANGTYLIKTIKSTEAATLLDVFLPRYRDYMLFGGTNNTTTNTASSSNNNNNNNGRSSLLNRICGFYRVELPVIAPNNLHHQNKKTMTQVYTFVVMNSVFPAHVTLNERFDLKGSTRGRRATSSESVGKDLDLIDPLVRSSSLSPSSSTTTARKGRGSDGTANRANDYEENDPNDAETVDAQRCDTTGTGLILGASAKRALLEQLRRDVELLRSCSLIDYSLLVGIALRSTTTSAAAAGAGQSNNNPVRRMARLLLRLLLLLAKDNSRYNKGHYARPTTNARGRRVSSAAVVDAGALAVLPGHRLGDPAVYYLGLIDFLQPFNTRKYIEYQLKALVYNRRSFSCIPPDAYADRFLDFMATHIK